MTGPTHTRPTRTRRRRPRALLAVGALALAALASACTPAQFQRWWTDGGRAPLSEPELSTLAAAAPAAPESLVKALRKCLIGSKSNSLDVLKVHATKVNTGWKKRNLEISSNRY